MLWLTKTPWAPVIWRQTKILLIRQVGLAPNLAKLLNTFSQLIPSLRPKILRTRRLLITQTPPLQAHPRPVLTQHTENLVI